MQANNRKSILILSFTLVVVMLGYGIVLPILPTVPFYLLTAFCFANSSERLHNWFLHTTVYKKYIGSYFRRATVIETQFGDIDHHLARYSALSFG